ncbi:MAG: C39 family peptidase [Peptostreptococcaceae bacterium]
MSKNFDIKKYSLISLGLISVLTFGFSILPVDSIGFKSKTKNISVLSEDVKSQLDMKNPAIKNLLDLYSKNNSLVNILNNTNEIPSELLTLASNNPETLDFVSNYLSYEPNDSLSVETDYTPGEIPLFLQWDERWGYHEYGDKFMAINGCAPTTLAMVVVGLTGNTSINPQTMVDYSYENGYYVDDVGTSWSLMSEGARNFGVNGMHININEYSILSSLEKGHPVVASVKPGLFTTTGHFLVVTGLNEDGTLRINDPNSKINSSTNWEIDAFLREVKALWEMSVL